MTGRWTLLTRLGEEASQPRDSARRGSKVDDKLRHRKMVPVELFDAAIRIFDVIGMYFPDDAAALLEKLKYNAKRADHKPENRLKAGGKKF